MKSLVSVVIPTYNHAHFLGKAIQSVLDQTYSNWEMLIIDNHSTDNTDEIVNSFNEPRIQLLKIKNNGVIAASRNKGISKAKGDWVAFLDSDDCWYPRKLETVMNVALKIDDCDVYSTNEYMVNSKTGERSVLSYGPYKNNFYEVLLLEGNCLSPSATIIKCSFLKNNDIFFNESPDYIAVEDYDLWLRLALFGAKFYFINSIQGEYIIHPGNNSAQLLRQRKNFEKLLYDHVFTIQKFHPAPIKLWEKFIPMLNILEVHQLKSDRNLILATIKFIKSFFPNPFLLLNYLIRKVIKRLKT